MNIVKIKFINDKFYESLQEVLPPTRIINLLKGKGNNSFCLINKDNVQYAQRENN
jgi:hypothetical protein